MAADQDDEPGELPADPLLGRTEDTIRSKAQAEGISSSPPNRSPYGAMS